MNLHLCSINAKRLLVCLFVLLTARSSFSEVKSLTDFQAPLALEAYKKATLPKIEIQEDDILFRINTANLINEEYMLSFLKGVKKEVGDRLINITIEGHTCDLGTRAYNEELGEERAYKMMDIIVMEGLNINMLEVISKGETSPRLANTHEQNRQKNRRVVVTVESVDSDMLSANKPLFDKVPVAKAFVQKSYFVDLYKMSFPISVGNFSIPSHQALFGIKGSKKLVRRSTDWVWEENIADSSKPQMLPPV